MRIADGLIIFSTFLLFCGCSAHNQDARIDFKAPEYVQQLPAKEATAPLNNPGSLFGRGDNPVFSDKKAMHINDIVTVVIDENILSSSSGSKKISKNTNDSLGGGVMTAPNGGILGNVASQTNKFTNIGVGIKSGNTFDGSGINKRTEKFTTTISARIIKILQNGNYFIDGRREMLIDGQKQILHVSGVIRPEDISQTNEINSKYIADAKILYEAQGDIAQATKKSWGTKAVESIWPF